MTIRMGFWDCRACGHKRIDGPLEKCTGCGQPRDRHVEFYTDDDAAVVEDPEMIARARAGADWRCKYCGAENRAGIMDCHQCGAGPDGSKRREEQYIPNQPGAAVPGAAVPGALSPATPAKKSNALVILLIVLGVIGALGAGVWFLFLRTTEEKVEVTSVAWQKTLQIEERRVETLKAWANEVPKGAKVLKREQKPREKKVKDGTKKVKVGKKDLGNGMFEDIYEEKPKFTTKKVDDTWVTFEIEKWVKGKKLKDETKDGSEPDKPKFTKSKKKRAGKRENKLVIGLKDGEGEKYTYELDLSDVKNPKKEVASFKKGDKYTAEVNTVGKVLELR